MGKQRNGWDFVIDVMNGMGRGLFAYAVKLCRDNDAELRCITVNASVNSVWSYEAMGFRWTDEERVENGIRYVPMELAL